MDCRRSTAVVWLGSSTVPVIGLFRWRYNASNGVIFVGKSVRNLVGRLQAYRCDQYHNSRHSGAISLSMVCGSTVLAQGQFCRRISMNSCLSSGNSSFIGHRLISTTIIGIAGVSAQQLSDLGSSTVRASGSNSG